MSRTARVSTTARGTVLRLSPEAPLSLGPAARTREDAPTVFVDPSRRFQTFLGIGAALTDAAAETFARLPAARQEEVLSRCFDRASGNGYTLARTHVHSCDFSSASYTYVEDHDRTLASFDVSRDERFRLPFIRRAIAAAGGRLDLLVSPWSPPAWMKDNAHMLQGGRLLPADAPVWAEYLVRFIEAYERRGVPVWGLTVQNEPAARQTWESCLYSAEEERDFIRDHLGPALRRHGLSDRRLIAWDHNRDFLFARAATLLADPEAAAHVWGIGYHWYESWSGPARHDNVRLTAEAFPDKPLLLTEACHHPFDWATFEDWRWGERYGEAMIGDFNSGAAGWIDWNILLDETGGPNHVGNFCFAPLHGDTRDGRLHVMNSHHYIGHFSRFIRPGARRIACSTTVAGLQATAFANPDDTLAVVVMNPGEEAVAHRLEVGGLAADTVSRPRSITTFVL